MNLLEWVFLNLDPDLTSELERDWAEERRYASVEAFVENLPARLKPDRNARRKIQIPMRLLAGVRALTQLHSLPALKSTGKALSYMTHYGLVKLLSNQIDWKKLYRLNRSLSLSMSVIERFYGSSTLDLMFTPVAHYSEPMRATSIVPLYYDREGTIMNNLDTAMAVFGQLLPLDMAVTWAVAIALKESHVARENGLSKIGEEITTTMRRQADRNLREKVQLMKIMASHPGFVPSTPNPRKVGEYLRWL